jgi:hypothetical protein
LKPQEKVYRTIEEYRRAYYPEIAHEHNADQPYSLGSHLAAEWLHELEAHLKGSAPAVPDSSGSESPREVPV